MGDPSNTRMSAATDVCEGISDGGQDYYETCAVCWNQHCTSFPISMFDLLTARNRGLLLVPFGAFLFICITASIVLRFTPKLRRRTRRSCFLATAVWAQRAQYRSPSACRRWFRGCVLFLGDLSDAGLAVLILLAAEWATTFWITFYYHNHSEYTIKTASYSVIIASGLLAAQMLLLAVLAFLPSHRFVPVAELAGLQLVRSMQWA